jgi:hypothetical protein
MNNFDSQFSYGDYLDSSSSLEGSQVPGANLTISDFSNISSYSETNSSSNSQESALNNIIVTQKYLPSHDKTLSQLMTWTNFTKV